MKHTKIFALVLAAILSASALCACQSPSPDPADTTPAPPLSEVVETTTPALTTPVIATPTPDTPNAPEALVGKVTSPDDISLKGIKVDVYKLVYPAVKMDPGPSSIQTKNYRPYNDFSHFDTKYVYMYSVYTDSNSEFSIEMTDDSMALRFDHRSLPKQYGVRQVLDEYYSYNEYISIYSLKENSDFALERVEDIRIERISDVQHFRFRAVPYSKDNKPLYADCGIVNGRFDDDFVDAMIEGSTINYTATLVCGDLTVEKSCEIDLAGSYYYWEWRVEYLYYNNYINKAQMDEIFRTREPSEPLIYM